MISVSKSKIYTMIAEGKIPSRRFGHSIRVPIAALQAMAQPEQSGSDHE